MKWHKLFGLHTMHEWKLKLKWRTCITHHASRIEFMMLNVELMNVSQTVKSCHEHFVHISHSFWDYKLNIRNHIWSMFKVQGLWSREGQLWTFVPSTDARCIFVLKFNGGSGFQEMAEWRTIWPRNPAWASMIATVSAEYQMKTAKNNDDNEPNLVDKMLPDCSFAENDEPQ